MIKNYDEFTKSHSHATVNPTYGRGEGDDPIEILAQDYLEDYGDDMELDDISKGHQWAQGMPVMELLERTAKVAGIDDALKVIGWLLEANEYRTMDMMGICKFLTKDAFEEIYPEYTK